MKRVLYFHHGGAIGGAPLSLLYLLQALDRERYEPIVVTIMPGPVVELFRAEGIETHVETGITKFGHTNLDWYGGWNLWPLPGKLLRILPSIRRARTVIRRFGPDLVHLNSSGLVLPAIAAAREGVPFVWHIREPLHPGYFGLRRAWIRGVLHRHAARAVAISQHDADQLLPGEHVRVIYNFVHFEQFDRSLTGDSIRAELGIPADAPVVTMLGGVARPKGTLTLVQALPALVRAVPGVRVIIAGPPPRPLDEPGLKGLAKRLLRVDAYQKTTQAAVAALPPDVREALIFTGVRRDVPALLAATDCLVFPSSVAHFARPIIEAAAMGVPAVASDVGGPQELVVEGETGLLVPPGDPAALAEALAALLNDPNRAAALGEAAYQRARRLFDARQNAAATIALYDEILSNNLTP